MILSLHKFDQVDYTITVGDYSARALKLQAGKQVYFHVLKSKEKVTFCTEEGLLNKTHVHTCLCERTDPEDPESLLILHNDQLCRELLELFEVDPASNTKIVLQCNEEGKHKYNVLCLEKFHWRFKK
jgi:hypothetical protein